MRIQTRHIHARIARRLVDYVMRHPSGPLLVPELADHAGMSAYHLARLFLDQTGETPASFVRRIRLERAAHRLIHTDIVVSNIAFEAGYAVHSNFGRAFQKHYRQAPSNFRRFPDDWRLNSPSGLHWQPNPDTLALRPADLTESEPEVEVISRPNTPYVFWRFEGNYKNLEKAWQQLHSQVPPGDLTYITVYHDTLATRDPDRMRADLGFFGTEPPENWQTGCLPAGAYVRSLHPASGHQHHLTWCTMHRHWIPSKGQRPVNVPAFEESTQCPGTQKNIPFHVTIGLELDLGHPDAQFQSTPISSGQTSAKP